MLSNIEFANKDFFWLFLTAKLRFSVGKRKNAIKKSPYSVIFMVHD